MKLSILITFSFMLVLGSFKQAYSQKYDADFQVEAGINFGGIWNMIRSNSYDSFQYNNNYNLSCKVILNKYAIRSGVGLRFDQDQSKKAELLDVISTNYRNLNLRLGVERQFDLEGKWLIYGGIDGVFSYFRNFVSEDSGFDQLIRVKERNTYGAALVSGIQFHIIPRLVIATEVSFQYQIYYETEQLTFDVFSDFNGPLNENSGSKFLFLSPNVLYLSYKF
ncbi:MAG: hypothetical protein HOP11_15555 [Saprospiraceae bacterium]|nr:hypothetical protein [Saprospiraceae bacterium]